MDKMIVYLVERSNEHLQTQHGEATYLTPNDGPHCEETVSGSLKNCEQEDTTTYVQRQLRSTN